MEFYDVIHPNFKETRRIRTTQSTGYSRYFAFPAILKTDENTVLIAHKNGIGHGDDKCRQVSLDQLTLDIKTNTVVRTETIYEEVGKNPQMGEYVKMPNGDICVYIDMQNSQVLSQRTGMEVLRSSDGGSSYGEPQRVGIIDGVEYGYPFDSCEKNGRLYMLVMTFPYLTGSKDRRQVHVISTDDNGISWRRESNLTEALGIEFNESALVATENGFILCTRGEHARHLENTGNDMEASACIYVLNDKFEAIRARDYRLTRADVSQFGRPRIYLYEGKLMLVTRQMIRTCDGVRMVLDLFAVNPETLEILSRVRLDDPFSDQQDGHYASLFLDGEDRLCAIDYETCATPANPSISRKPDIIMMAFSVSELKAQHKEMTGFDF